MDKLKLGVDLQKLVVERRSDLILFSTILFPMLDDFLFSSSTSVATALSWCNTVENGKMISSVELCRDTKLRVEIEVKRDW